MTVKVKEGSSPYYGGVALPSQMTAFNPTDVAKQSVDATSVAVGHGGHGFRRLYRTKRLRFRPPGPSLGRSDCDPAGYFRCRRKPKSQRKTFSHGQTEDSVVYLPPLRSQMVSQAAVHPAVRHHALRVQAETSAGSRATPP